MSTTEIDTTTTTEPTAQAHTWRRPRYDVLESDDAFDVKVSLPGVQRGGVNISVDGDNLSITGTRTHSAIEGWRPLRRELPEGDYRLNLRLNVGVKEANIRAHVEDGILDLTLPKADVCKARKIKVN
jgi:HSP20 family protein